MAKRAFEGIALLIAVIIIFAAVNALAKGAENNFRRIDGEYYSISERSLSLMLMTEEGTQCLTEFDRLEELTVRPYIYAAANVLDMGDKAQNAVMRKEAEKAYPDCTRLADLSFLRPLTGLVSLDVSYCCTADLSFLSEMGSLKQLDISYTYVSDLSVLGRMDSIETLTLCGIPAEDYSPLLEMKGLTVVNLDSSAEGEVTKQLSEKGVKVTFKDKEDKAQGSTLPRSTEEAEPQMQSQAQ